MSAHNVKHIKIRAIHDWVIVSDMDFGDITTAAGIIIKSDDAKAHGVKPRWGKVYRSVREQNDVKIGDWILIEHGRWTRAMHINDGERELKAHRVDVAGIIAISDEKPNDIYFGKEANHGDSIEIRPEDFGAR